MNMNLDKARVERCITEYILIIRACKKNRVGSPEDLLELNRIFKTLLDYIATGEMTSAEDFALATAKIVMKYAPKETMSFDDYFKSAVDEVMIKKAVSVLNIIRNELLN